MTNRFSIEETANVVMYDKITNEPVLTLNTIAVDATYERNIIHADYGKGDSITGLHWGTGFGTMQLRDAKIGEGLLELAKDEQMFTIRMSGTLLPRGNKLPKKKRIRNKWMKKYVREYEFKNCSIKL